MMLLLSRRDLDTMGIYISFILAICLTLTIAGSITALSFLLKTIIDHHPYCPINCDTADHT